MPVPCAIAVKKKWKWQVHYLTSCNRYAIKLHGLAAVQIEVCFDINTAVAVRCTGDFHLYLSHWMIFMGTQ